MQTIAQHSPFGSTTTINHTGAGRALWAGRVISGLAVAFLIFDSLAKLFEIQPVIDGTRQLGYRPEIAFKLGVTLLTCVLVYLVPQTTALGAVLLTGYLGGAVATLVRVGSPLLTHVLFPTYIAALLWGGALLRDARLRAFMPWSDRSR
jgi:hypothetical protein